MTTAASPASVPPANPSQSPAAARSRTGTRIVDWLGAVFAAIVWSPFLAGLLLDTQTFAFFLLTMATYLLMSLLFAGWWFTRRSFTGRQRLAVFAGAVLSGVGVGLLSGRAIKPPLYLVLFGLPVVLTVWAVWVPMISRRSPRPAPPPW